MQVKEFITEYKIRVMKDIFRKLPVFLLPLLILGIYFLFRYNLLSQESWKLILVFLFSVAFALSLVPFRNYFDFKLPKKLEKWLPYIVAGLGFVIYGLYGIVKFYHFGFPTWDFGLFDQIIWRISRFQEAGGSLLGNHLLGDHFSPILYIIAPIFWFFNHPIALILFEILVVCLGCLPIFWISKKYHKSNLLSFAMSFAYIFYVGNQFALNFSFHATTLFAPLFLFAFYFFEEKKYFWHFVFIILALMCREDIGLYIFAYGVYLLVRRCALGIVHVFMGGIWFFITTGYLMPYFAKSVGGVVPNRFVSYGLLGETPTEMIKTVISHPVFAFSLFFDNQVKVLTFLSIFIGFGFLAILAPSFWLILLPMLGIRFWSTNRLFWLMEFHYGAPISAVLVLSTIFAVLYLKRSIKFPWDFFIGTFLIINTLSITYLFQLPVHNIIHKSFWNSNEQILSAREAISLIPKDASISAQDLFVSHLAHRNEIFLFPAAINNARFILLDIKRDTYPIKQEEYRQRVKEVLADPNYGIRFNQNSVILFEKGLKSNLSPSPEILNFINSNQ